MYEGSISGSLDKEKCMKECKKKKKELHLKGRENITACEWQRGDGLEAMQCLFHYGEGEERNQRGNGDPNYHCCVYKDGNLIVNNR